MKSILIKNCLIFRGKKLVKVDILINKGLIEKIEKQILDRAEIEIEADKKFLSAGFIDAHSHWREPGFSYKETVRSGSEAAAKGGFTTAFLMPNLDPAPDNLENLKKELDIIANSSLIEAFTYATITKERKGKEVSKMEEMSDYVIGFSDDGSSVEDSNVMFTALQKAAKLKKIIANHCEDLDLAKKGVITRGDLSLKMNLKPFSSLAESARIARDLELVRATNSRYHICHISNRASLNLVKIAKDRGLLVTCEVTPHHLTSSVEDIKENNGFWKMKPPLSSKADRLALIKAANRGLIDIIATDHAPHSLSEKGGGFENSEFGIIGLETAFPLLYTRLVREGKMSLKRLTDMLTYKVANLFGIDRGVIKEGCRADLVLIDLDKKKLFRVEDIKSGGKNSPYIGEELFGFPVLTISGGRIVYEESEN